MSSVQAVAANGCTACLPGAMLSSGVCSSTCPIGQFEQAGVTCAVAAPLAQHAPSPPAAHRARESASPIYHDAACQATCPDGLYANSNYKCSVCDSSCETCSGGSPADCVSCASATPYKQGSECVSSCPAGSSPTQILSVRPATLAVPLAAALHKLSLLPSQLRSCTTTSAFPSVGQLLR